ncbi:hypothetical protein Tco_1285079 [Tanacetum coccineum]
MHTRASNSELVEQLPEPERTPNQRLCQRNKRVPFDQRNNPPQHPRVAYPPIININYFRHFLDILRNYDPIDDEPMWAANRVVSLTPSSSITIPKIANEFAIKGSSNSDTDKIMARMDAMTIKMDAQYKELQSRAKKPTPDLDEDDMPMPVKKRLNPCKLSVRLVFTMITETRNAIIGIQADGMITTEITTDPTLMINPMIFKYNSMIS